MIVVRFRGRLGNQLFQYAFALATAKRFKTFFLIDRINDSSFVKYFDIYNSQTVNKLMLYFFRRKIICIEDASEKLKTRIDKLSNNTYYDGFFQSEIYFDNVKRLVIKKFQVRKKYKEMFESKFGELFFGHKIIAIHCRIGDYVNAWNEEDYGSIDLILPEKYYKNALAMIEDIQNYKIIIVTDDIEKATSKFDFINDKIIVSEDEIIDFQILQNANKLIIANSTFSWWAAYLNHKNATVFAPQYWLGFKVNKEMPEAIIPENYVRVKFDTEIYSKN
jgi:hypothetical protein